MPQGSVVGAPQSSPLMKLPMRPVNSPTGISGAAKSAMSNTFSWFFQANRK